MLSNYRDPWQLCTNLSLLLCHHQTIHRIFCTDSAVLTAQWNNLSETFSATYYLDESCLMSSYHRKYKWIIMTATVRLDEVEKMIFKAVVHLNYKINEKPLLVQLQIIHLIALLFQTARLNVVTRGGGGLGQVS
jgi:hypothetical protein